MREYAKVEPKYEAIEGLGDILEECEMSKEERGFLCGLIRDNAPKKLLEVGVAAGGTTALILSYLETLGGGQDMYSVDLSENLYYAPDKKTGYVTVNYLKSHKSTVKHRFMIGRFLPEVLDDIGSNIDFVILDTVHHLPGEILDFLAVLPYLSDGAVIVLHDVSLQHNNSSSDPYCFSNQILFDCVTGDKFLNNAAYYPNIAAFKIGDDTLENILDVFSAMSLTWSYLPDEKEINIYRKAYMAHYPDGVIKIFEQSVELNKKSLHKMNMLSKGYIEALKDSLFKQYSHILLYGAGKRGKCFYRSICNGIMGYENRIEYIVSEKKDGKDYIVWNDLNYPVEDTLIVLTANSEELRKRLVASKWHWIDVPEYIWASLEIVYGSEAMQSAG